MRTQLLASAAQLHGAHRSGAAALGCGYSDSYGRGRVLSARLSTLSSIGRVVAVTSCKGGVGKSTVSYELASSLARRGHRVGLFDADVHGPSLPSQVKLAQVGEEGAGVPMAQLSEDGMSVLPLRHDGMALMCASKHTIAPRMRTALP